MSLLTPFIVLIERLHWRQRGRAVVASLLTLALTLPGLPVQAGPGKAKHKAHKVALDLQQEVEASHPRKVHWSRDSEGRRMVQVVFVSNDADENMASLRDHILRAGGSVSVVMPGLRMLTAVLPARQVAMVAERSDVEFVTPNRATRRTASTLEAITGATSSGVRSSSTKTATTAWMAPASASPSSIRA